MKFEAGKERIFPKTTSNQLNEDGQMSGEKKLQKHVCVLVQRKVAKNMLNIIPSREEWRECYKQHIFILYILAYIPKII